MLNNIIKKGQLALSLVAVISLVSSNVVYAASGVTYSVDTTVTVNGLNLTIQAGSKAGSVIIGATTLTVNTDSSDNFTIVSTNRYSFSATPALGTNCTNDQSTIVVTPGLSEVITPSSTVCTPAATGGSSGGGGGGGSPAPTPVVAPVVVPPVVAPIATPVGAFYDVPDTGKADAAVSIMDTLKINLEILKNTSFSTDVKGEKKMKYTDTVVAPTFVDITKVAAKALPKDAKLLLAVQAVTTKQVKLSKMATWTIPVAADVAALKSKLKAYYVNVNTGMPSVVLGGKMNAAKTAFVVKAKNLGGLLLLVKKN